MRIEVNILKELVLKVLETKYSEEESRKIAEVLLFAEYADKKSHGINRLLGSASSIMEQKPTRDIEIINKSRISRLINGHGNAAMLVTQIAMEEAIDICKQSKISIVGTKNTFSSSGCLSYYLQKIANNGFIGIMMARPVASIAPFDSIEKLLGTNPIGFGIPTNSNPFIFDMGTSAISIGELLNAIETDKTIPKNVAIDEMGNPTIDPNKAFEGSLLPFDKSYKSSGLAFTIEILAGILPGAGFSDINSNEGWGSIVICIDPELLIEPEEFRKKVTELISRIKKAKTNTEKQIRLPGERMQQEYQKTIKSGYVEINEKIFRSINSYLKSCKIN